ncbi:MAG: hypothetical protein QOI24_1644 [Acidobacteriota bacterium]|jgi:uncharacterized RDD family membrane protein YckC|nr:hypothetical protein [Acidobacteriota bacterium]
MTDLPPVAVCSNHPDIGEGVHRCSRCARSFCADCLVLIGGSGYCALCKNEQLRDVRSGVDPGTMPFASRGRRFGGYLVDVLPWMILSGFVVYRAMALGKFVTRIDPTLIVATVTYVAYDALMIQFRSQTFGKMAAHTKVVRVDGTGVTAGQAWIRALTRWALGYLYVADWITIFFTRERLCVHDMLAKTRVVNTD